MTVVLIDRHAVAPRGVFATGRARSDAAELARLRAAAEEARLFFERYRSHDAEIRKVYAEQAVDDFIAAHPELDA